MPIIEHTVEMVEFLHSGFQQLRLTVSQAKTMVVASSPDIAQSVVGALKASGICLTAAASSLPCRGR